MEHFLAVAFFAVSATVTPGPNNIMMMSSGVNFGIKRSLPLLAGICFGFALMLFLVGMGFSQVFNIFPELFFIIKCIGVIYLLYLAYLIAKSSGMGESTTQTQPFSFMKGVLFQWVNAKAWVVATGAIAAFTSVGASFHSQTLQIAATFLVISFPCVGLWLSFGSWLKSIMRSEKSRRWFNLTMSGLLVISVVPVIDEILSQAM